MTLLEIVQQHCRRTGITVPAIVVSSQEDQIQQCLGLLNEELDEVVPRTKWQDLRTEAVFTSSASDSQGALATLFPGLVDDWLVPETFWDRTEKLPLHDPQTPQSWAALKALGSVPTNYPWMIRGGELLVAGIPAGHTLAVEYISNRAVMPAVGDAKQYFTLDDDSPKLPSTIILAGLRWRWKREQGLDYAEDFRRYEGLVNTTTGRQGNKPVIDASGESAYPPVGIHIPDRSWPL